MSEIETRICNLYGMLMDELAHRQLLLDTLIKNPMKLAIIPNFELCQLQVRKICEIFALACLVTHEGEPKLKKSIKKEKGSKIICELKKLNPHFFPKPYNRGGVPPAKFEHMGYLTQEELVTAYHKTGMHLHRGTFKMLQKRWMPDMDITPKDYEKMFNWNVRLCNLLLPYHSIQLSDGRSQLVCQMSSFTNDKFARCEIKKV